MITPVSAAYLEQLDPEHPLSDVGEWLIAGRNAMEEAGLDVSDTHTLIPLMVDGALRDRLTALENEIGTEAMLDSIRTTLYRTYAR